METKIKSLPIILTLIFIIGCKTMFGSIPGTKSIFGNDNVVKLIENIKFGNMKVVNELIQSGVDINYKGKQDVTPLYYFFMIKDYNSFKRILELGANPNVDPKGLGMYYLINYSMYSKDDRYFKLLLKYNVDVNYIPPGGEGPPLDFSLDPDIDIKYLKMLLEHGIKPYYSEILLKNPISRALTVREYKKIILLLDYYPDYLKDERPIEIYQRTVTIKQMFIEDLEACNQAPGSQFLKDQQELVKYLKDKFNIDVKLQYPNGK